MTIISKTPDDGDMNVPPHIHPSFVLTDTAADDVEVWVNAVLVEPEFIAQVDDLLVVIHPDEPFDIETLITIDVSVSGDMSSWSFTTGDAWGPTLAEVSPAPGEILTASPSNITGRLEDAGALFAPVARLEYFRANNAEFTEGVVSLPSTLYVADGTTDGAYFETAGAHTFTADDVGKIIAINYHELRIVEFVSASRVGVEREWSTAFENVDWELLNHELRDCKDCLLEVTSGLSVGERRRITEVTGRHQASYEGPLLTGDEFIIYKNSGLNIHVDGQLIIHSGYLDRQAELAGWTATITDDEFDLVVPVSWTDRSVRIHIQATDNNPDLKNSSDINFHFTVGDTQGPIVSNISPEPDSRDLDVDTQDLVFDLTSANGVDLTTINVEVDGTLVINNGTPQGDYSTSTVTPIADGYLLTLTRTSSYVDGDIVFFDITSSDSLGNEGARRVIRLQFGSTIASQAVVHGLGGNDIVRVLSYDLTATSFCQPVALKHTGYAWDGYWYTNGNKGTARASWHTLGNFLTAGLVVVTATNGWSLVRAGGGAWMTCTPAVAPAWSMAGNGTTTDAAFGPDAVLMLGGNINIVVDFVRDRAEKFSSDGRTIGTQTISQRNSDQSGSLDTDYATSSFVTRKLAGYRDQDSFLLVFLHDQSVTMAHGVTGVTPKIVTRTETRWSSATWYRARFMNWHFFIGYNDGGQGQVELWNWSKFLENDDEDLFLDDGTTPPLPTGQVMDLDINADKLMIAMDHYLVIIDRDTLSKDEYDETTLGLVLAGGSISALSSEDTQYIVATASMSDGRVVRFLPPATSTVLDSGTPFTTIAALGSADV